MLEQTYGVGVAQAIYDNQAEWPDELTFKRGEILRVLNERPCEFSFTYFSLSARKLRNSDIHPAILSTKQDQLTAKSSNMNLLCSPNTSIFGAKFSKGQNSFIRSGSRVRGLVKVLTPVGGVVLIKTGEGALHRQIAYECYIDSSTVYHLREDEMTADK
ncbi:unnamed protein product [Thelazia callipaeda]|uniref:SH3 domain-containing protein n=1 Tax=Thelazia callipaeda TaxID=103827 RepID=A0A0N5CMK0_THECL|nr:unnamed protein product [Thelazia callipaeda]